MLVCKQCGAEVGRRRGKKQNVRWCTGCGTDLSEQYGELASPAHGDATDPRTRTILWVALLLGGGAVLALLGVALAAG